MKIHVSIEQNKQNRVEVNCESGDLCPSAFCRSSTLQHSAVGPFGLTEFPLCSIGCIDNLISVTSALLHLYLHIYIHLLLYTQALLLWNKVEDSVIVLYYIYATVMSDKERSFLPSVQLSTITLADVHCMSDFVFKMSSLSQDLFVMVQSRCARYQASNISQHPKWLMCPFFYRQKTKIQLNK